MERRSRNPISEPHCVVLGYTLFSPRAERGSASRQRLWSGRDRLQPVVKHHDDRALIETLAVFSAFLDAPLRVPGQVIYLGRNSAYMCFTSSRFISRSRQPVCVNVSGSARPLAYRFSCKGRVQRYQRVQRHTQQLLGRIEQSNSDAYSDSNTVRE